MRRLTSPRVLTLLVVLARAGGPATCARSLEASGLADPNDFRIPGDGGTSSSSPITTGPGRAVRATLTWDLSARSRFRLLPRPALETTFTPDSPVVFQDSSSRPPPDATYVFNSYRLSCMGFPREKCRSAGGDAQGADAEIGWPAIPAPREEDLGVVPLLYLYARYQATDRFALELEADALRPPRAAPKTCR